MRQRRLRGGWPLRNAGAHAGRGGAKWITLPCTTYRAGADGGTRRRKEDEGIDAEATNEWGEHGNAEQ